MSGSILYQDIVDFSSVSEADRTELNVNARFEIIWRYIKILKICKWLIDTLI
jgi:hypothetical protein